MKILFLAAEVGPFVSIGGLSQVMYFLPRALEKRGQDIAIFTPKYGSMYTADPDDETWKLKMEWEGMRVPIENNVTDDAKLVTDREDYLLCNIKEYSGEKNEPTVHFLENREYYELRANVFGYGDDHIRFLLLAKGCLEWLLFLKRKIANGEEAWFPDVIHCNDWHTGYFLQLARQDKRYKDILAKIPLVFTVHNFHFQGNMAFRYLPKEEQDTGRGELAPLLSPKLLKQNALLRGIRYADSVNTVSLTHALEVVTPEYGEGLEDELQKIRGKLTGILNGLDISEFNPATDPIIKKNYSERTVSDFRPINKKDLQKTFFLPEDINKVVIGIAGRISRQKGWDLLIDMLPHLLSYDKDIQVIVLGDGDDMYKHQLQQMQKEFPNRIGLHLRSDFRLPRKIFAGADIVLVPSHFEPGGIIALEALRYGAVPLVRKTGGLADIVSEFDPTTLEGNGFCFAEKDPWVFFGKIVEAVTIFHQKELWNELIINCMKCDFSWDHVAKEYERLYKKMILEKKRSTGPTAHPAYKTTGE